MPERAYITPSVIKWARERAKLDLATAADKIGTKKERLELWEKGEAHPTLNQAMKMSKVYRRSLSVFYLPEPPTDFQTLRDFRRIKERRDYSTGLMFMMREVQGRQQWMKDFLTEEEEEPLSFIGKFSHQDNIKKVASDIISTLEIEDDINQKDRFKHWLQKAEDKRIFVCLGSNIHSHMVFDVNEFRGFAISDSLAPFIFINTKDAKQAQLFTLVHELVHLWIGESGVSKEIVTEFRELNPKELEPVELFCNSVAAEILMPQGLIESYLTEFHDISLQSIDQLAKKLQLSSKAILVRLSKIGKISSQSYNHYWNDIEKRNEQWRIENEVKSDDDNQGFPSPYLMKVRKCGYAFTNIVVGSYKSGRLSGVETSTLLDLKLNKLPKIEKYLYA
jgi:Zn-dependent peptidase ImmA (M78 family)/DNA-binding XRE family transcriptional regulator